MKGIFVCGARRTGRGREECFQTRQREEKQKQPGEKMDNKESCVEGLLRACVRSLERSKVLGAKGKWLGLWLGLGECCL